MKNEPRNPRRLHPQFDMVRASKEKNMIARLSLLALSLSCLFVPNSFAGWQDEWEKLAAGAKKEGRLFLAGPRGDSRRQALTETFEKKYGVPVEYLGVGGPELPPRVQRERQGGVYGWGAFIAGTSTLIRALRPIG